MIFWSTVLTASLVATAVATVVLVRSRSRPSLAQVIASAEREPVARPGGGEKP